MKKYLIIGALTVYGCGDAGSGGGDPELATLAEPKPVEDVAIAAKLVKERVNLPDCGETNQGALIYIQDEEQFVFCDEYLAWTEIDLQGPAGKDGANGINGKDGSQGIAGVAGEKGEKGETGATGPAGATGESMTVDKTYTCERSLNTQPTDSNGETYSRVTVTTFTNGHIFMDCQVLVYLWLSDDLVTKSKPAFFKGPNESGYISCSPTLYSSAFWYPENPTSVIYGDPNRAETLHTETCTLAE